MLGTGTVADWEAFLEQHRAYLETTGARRGDARRARARDLTAHRPLPPARLLQG